MKHILFPTAAAADAFIAEMQGRGVGMGTATYTRRDAAVVDGGGTAEDAAAGAVKGTGVGAAVGAAAGFLGTAGAIAAGVATGGLAIPVMLGMAALGSGVGAAVGAAGGAMGVDETGDHYETSDSYYDRMNSVVSGGGRVVAVQDDVSSDVLDAAARHGGEVVDASGDVYRVDRSAAGMGAGMGAGAAYGDKSTAGNAVDAAGAKVDEAADRLRAAGHSVAAAVTGNPKHDALAAEDRAKAEMNNREAHAEYGEAKREVRDGDGH